MTKKKKNAEKNFYNNYYESEYNYTLYAEMKEISQYDISSWENWKQVHSSCPLVWLLPVRICIGEKMWDNGINFKLNKKFEFEVVKSV